MKKKVLVLFVCMLLVSVLAIGTVSADTCKRKPNTTKIIQNSPPDAPEITVPNKLRRASWLNIETVSIDPENDNVYYKYDITPEETVADYRRILLQNLYDSMVNERLNELTKQPDPPFLYQHWLCL